MSMNQLAQNPSQAWTWQPTMDSHHHYFQVEQEQQGNYGREHMFEKPLTPSDVGKLNRLVIPKQHAEKYFPLDSESGEKGLLLSFEDESGRPWKFRYSYWSSSQSYVLTKGWSRYVKEKKLDAGDVILFERLRLRTSDDRLYIGCRRRKFNETTAAAAATSAQDAVTSNAAAAAAQPWSPTFYAQAASSPYPTPYYYMNSVNSGSSGESSAAASATTGNSRRLRLFGVNLECGPDPAESQHLVSDSWN